MLATQRISANTQHLQRTTYITGVTIKAMRVFIKLNRVCKEEESNVGEAMGVVSEGKARAKETQKEHHRGRRRIRTHYVMQANRMRGSKKKIQGLVQKPVGREKRQLFVG